MLSNWKPVKLPEEHWLVRMGAIADTSLTIMLPLFHWISALTSGKDFSMADIASRSLIGI
jgi:hypothetical protein